jgi:hypothetical protein
MLTELSAGELQSVCGGEIPWWEGSTGPTFPIPDDDVIVV